MKSSAAKICNESNNKKIAIIKWEIMKILVSKIHTIFFMKTEKTEKMKIIKSHCHLPLYHHVKNK